MMGAMRRPLRYRGLSRRRTEGVARSLGRFYAVSIPVVVALVGGLFAVLRRRDDNIFSELPLWGVFAIGVGLGLCVLVVWKSHGRRMPD